VPGAEAGRNRAHARRVIECTVRDFSLGGVGIELPAAISVLSTEFDLTFGQFTRRCETVWRQIDRMGLKRALGGVMGIRTRGLDIKAGAAKLKADRPN
jgi:hypothetical protein